MCKAGRNMILNLYSFVKYEIIPHRLYLALRSEEPPSSGTVIVGLESHYHVVARRLGEEWALRRDHLHRRGGRMIRSARKGLRLC